MKSPSHPPAFFRTPIECQKHEEQIDFIFIIRLSSVKINDQISEFINLFPGAVRYGLRFESVALDPIDAITAFNINVFSGSRASLYQHLFYKFFFHCLLPLHFFNLILQNRFLIVNSVFAWCPKLWTATRVFRVYSHVRGHLRFPMID